MRKLLLLALTAIIMAGCYTDGNTVGKGYSYVTVVYDSCEYVIANYTERMAHKGNCKFCEVRRKQEVKKLVEELKK